MEQEVLVFNTLDKSVSVQAFGNWFTFKPRQIKLMRGELGDFLVKEKGYFGLVGLPLEMSEPEYKASPEGQAILEDKRIEGINKRIQHLQRTVDNLLVSLPKDLSMKDIKVDPLKLASKGEVEAMEELRSYQVAREDEEKLKVEKLRVLERQLRANTGAPAAARKEE